MCQDLLPSSHLYIHENPYRHLRLILLELCTEELAELLSEEEREDGVGRWRKEKAVLCVQCRLTHWSCTDQMEVRTELSQR